jgi:hypothetical protein
VPLSSNVKRSGFYRLSRIGFLVFLDVSFGVPSSASVVAVGRGLESSVYCQPCVCVMRGAAFGILVWLRCAAHDASRESCVCLALGA